MGHVIVKDSNGRNQRIFFDNQYPELCPACGSDFIKIDGDGFDCLNCHERYNLVCSDGELNERIMLIWTLKI